jgi:hypothetical protein
MNDRAIENLLRRYRPAGPMADLARQITKSPDRQFTKPPPTWPWAAVAAALLVITVGLHAAVIPPPRDNPVADADRVRLLTEQLGASPEARAVAEWLAMLEAQAERDRLARAESRQDRQ